MLVFGWSCCCWCDCECESWLLVGVGSFFVGCDCGDLGVVLPCDAGECVADCAEEFVEVGSLDHWGAGFVFVVFGAGEVEFCGDVDWGVFGDGGGVVGLGVLLDGFAPLLEFFVVCFDESAFADVFF